MSDDKLAEARLDGLMSAAFEANHPAMLDYVALKFELKELLATCAEQAKEIEKAEQEIFQLEDDKAKLCAELAALKEDVRQLTERVETTDACHIDLHTKLAVAEAEIERLKKFDVKFHDDYQGLRPVGKEYDLLEWQAMLQTQLGLTRVRLQEITAKLAAAVAENKRQADELARIWALPEQEWAQVGAIVMQILAHAAKQGYPVKDTDAVKAIDRGKTYVARLQARLLEAEAEVERLKASEVTADELREQIDKAQAETRAVRCDLAAAEQRAAQAELNLARIGDRAVVNWDDETVGEVDRALKGRTYAEALKAEALSERVKGMEWVLSAMTPELLECAEDDGAPIYLHAEDCPSYCDYACNDKGEQIAKVFGLLMEPIRAEIARLKAGKGESNES